MPYKKNYKKRKPRKRNYKKSIPKSFPLGKSHLYRGRYCEFNLQLNPTVGGIPDTYVFSLNGLYDPNITGTGHQPIGFDQLMLMFNHYTVLSTVAKVQFNNTDTSNAVTAALSIKDTSSVVTTLSRIIENGRCVYKVLGPETNGSSTKNLTITCSMKKFFGKTVYTEHDFRGDASNNPPEQAYLHISVAPRTTSDQDAVWCTVQLDYIALFHEPKLLTSS